MSFFVCFQLIGKNIKVLWNPVWKCNYKASLLKRPKKKAQTCCLSQTKKGLAREIALEQDDCLAYTSWALILTFNNVGCLFCILEQTDATLLFKKEKFLSLFILHSSSLPPSSTSCFFLHVLPCTKWSLCAMINALNWLTHMGIITLKLICSDISFGLLKSSLATLKSLYFLKN